MAYEEYLQIEGNSLEDCRNKLHKKYGNDYQIRNKEFKYVPAGFLHLKQKTITVVYYSLNHQKSYEFDNRFLQPQNSVSRINEEESLAKNREAILQNQSTTLMNVQMKQLNETINELKNEMNEKLNGIQISSQEKHETIKKIEELLVLNDFSFSFIQMINDKICSEFSLEQLNDFDLVEKKVIEWIGKSIFIAKTQVYRPPHVYIIVGPTGVGKTTTLVKMATQFMLSFIKENNQKRPDICFITTDSMRVGAMEQLERFGTLMKIPVLKAEKTEDLKTLYENHKMGMDAIFIDTSGYSPNDAGHLAHIKMLLDIPNMNPDIYLAFTASTKSRDLQNIMKNYEPFGYNSVIVTKCDESEQIGNVISVIYEKHKSISFITDGQVASRNISKAKITELLMRLEGFNINKEHLIEVFGE